MGFPGLASDPSLESPPLPELPDPVRASGSARVGAALASRAASTVSSNVPDGSLESAVGKSFSIPPVPACGSIDERRGAPMVSISDLR
ncbi:MAG: hypothetical protein C0498_04945 [Anaerolinea sp.]|nr:hypothetical protein [Anaerolinea sp.]